MDNRFKSGLLTDRDVPFSDLVARLESRAITNGGITQLGGGYMRFSEGTVA
jgi:hypothetical protein